MPIILYVLERGNGFLMRVEMRIHVPNREFIVLPNIPHNLVSNLSKDMGFSSINRHSINNVQ